MTATLPHAGPAETPAETPAGTTLLRLTVLCRQRRADLTVPGQVAVAELLPELAAAVGVLDATVVHAGYRLRTAAGGLRADAGLVEQGVGSGCLLTLDVAADDTQQRVYDDVTEAVADSVQAQVVAWDPAASRRTALAAAATLFTVVAVLLVAQRSAGLLVTAVGAALAVVLLAAAMVISRLDAADEAAVVLALTAAAPAAAAGLAAAPGDLLQLPLCLAGVAVLLTGLVARVAVRRHAALLPAVVLGAAATAVGAVCAASGGRPAPVVAVVLVLAVALVVVVPTLAATAARLHLPSSAHAAGPPDASLAPVLRARVQAGQEIALALSAALGLLLVLSAPFVVQLGISGALLGVASCAVVLLRTRHSRSRAHVAAGLVSGTAGTVALSVTACALGPSWRPALSGVLLAVSAALVLVAVVPRARGAWAGRLADVAEGVALTSLVPLLVLATGLVADVRR